MDTWRLLTSCWRLDPLVLAVCLAAAIAYLAPGRRFGVRLLPFGAALLLFVLALASPIGQLADGYLFSAHMLQHLLLVLVVPPLALLAVAPALRARAPGWVGRLLLSRPIVTWGLGVGAMWLWHEQTLCNAASQSAVVHRVQELSLLMMGTAFWWPVLAPREESRLPPLSGVVYLFTACVACTLLGVLITFSPVEVCSVFAHPVDRLGVMPLVRDGWGLTAEKDQQVGGLLMWVPACLVYGIGILGVLGRLFREHPTSGSVSKRWRHDGTAHGGAQGLEQPKPDLIPRSTAWPAAMALGVTLLAWGLITSPVVLGVGVALFAVSLAGWIGEIRHER